MGELVSLDFKDVRHTFIETGYGWGKSLQSMRHYAFEEFHSIEIDPTISMNAQTEWRHDPRVTIHYGDSRKILPHIIEPYNSTTFWLDAHYSGTIHYGEADVEGQCPILDELDIIVNTSWRADITVLIDDVRLFTPEWWDNVRDTPNLRREEWPQLHEIYQRLEGFELNKDIPDILIARYYATP